MDINKYAQSNKILHAMEIKKTNPNYPISVEIHPTNICNYNCDYCSYAIRKANKQRINFDVLMDLCNSLIQLKVKTVYFAGGGDPTMYKGLDIVMQYLYENGVKLALLTNGSNNKMLTKVARYCEYILIHVASHDPQIYQELMGKEQKDVLEVANLIKTVSSKPKIGARIVVVNRNMPSLVDSVKVLLNKNFDYVQCTPGTDFESVGIKLDWDKLKEVFSDPIFKEKNVMAAYKEGQTNDYNPTSQCLSIVNRLHAIVNATGGVYLCPPLTGLGDKYSIGNINENNFLEIWNGQKHEETIAFLNKCYSRHACKNCRFIGYNRYLEELEDARMNPHALFI